MKYPLFSISISPHSNNTVIYIYYKFQKVTIQYKEYERRKFVMRKFLVATIIITGVIMAVIASNALKHNVALNSYELFEIINIRGGD